MSYIGLRVNNQKCDCCPKQEKQLLMAPRNNYSCALDDINFELMVKNMNLDLRRYFDKELR